MVRVAVFVAPLAEAEIVTVVGTTTILVLTVKLTLAAPAGTVTVAGTGAAWESLVEIWTCRPPMGADPFRVTVPAEVPSSSIPPTTLVGFMVSDNTLGGSLTLAKFTPV